MTVKDTDDVRHLVDGGDLEGRGSGWTRCGRGFTRYKAVLEQSPRLQRGSYPYFDLSDLHCNCIPCMNNELNTVKRTEEHGVLFY